MLSLARPLPVDHRRLKKPSIGPIRRIACVAVLAQVVVLKVRFDDHPWIVGVVMGIAAGALFV